MVLEVSPALQVPFDENLKRLLCYLFFLTFVLSLHLCYLYAHMGYIHLQGLRLQQLSPFCNRDNRPSSSALAHLHRPTTLVAIAHPILSVHISSEMLCPSAATCWPPACVSFLLLSEGTPQYSVLLLHEFEHVLSCYFISLTLYYAQQLHILVECLCVYRSTHASTYDY